MHKLSVFASLGKSGPAAAHTTRSGFTLIELLVVVLIIGILTAFALPQYQVAVLKSRYVQLVTLADAICRSEEVYHLANNTYTTNLTDLDIKLPAGGSLNANGSVASFPSFRISLFNTGNTHAVVLRDEKSGLGYVNYCYRRQKECRSYNKDKREEQVCFSLGATRKIPTTEFDQYMLAEAER